MKKMLKNFWKIKNMTNFAVAKLLRGVAQLAARHVRDVEVGSSSLLTPTKQDNLSDHSACEVVIVYITILKFTHI